MGILLAALVLFGFFIIGANPETTDALLELIGKLLGLMFRLLIPAVLLLWLFGC